MVGVFDSGVGGRLGPKVAAHLAELGGHHQVLCVTHAPQVAALGNHHLRVEKTAEQDTQIHRLDADGRVAELARMLAGADVSAESREYARSLLREAQVGGAAGAVH